MFVELSPKGLDFNETQPLGIRLTSALNTLPLVKETTRLHTLPIPHDTLTCFFSNEDAIRSRSVSNIVSTQTLDLPALPARLLVDCEREVAVHLELQPGDVESLSLARARSRWPDYKNCVKSMSDWTSGIGLPGVLDTAEAALMVCRGAHYHHDGLAYGGAAFCNLFLSDDKELDLHFPMTGQCIALERGTAVIFDTGQPHAVIRRGSSGFDLADFKPEKDCTLLFLSWELPIEQADVAQMFSINFDVDFNINTDSAAFQEPRHPELFVNGKPGSVCPTSGRWRDASSPGRD